MSMADIIANAQSCSWKALSWRRLSSKSAVTSPTAEDALQLARDASIAGFETAKGGYDDCGICLDSAEEVAIDGCNHMLCGTHRGVDKSCMQTSLAALFVAGLRHGDPKRLHCLCSMRGVQNGVLAPSGSEACGYIRCIQHDLIAAP